MRMFGLFSGIGGFELGFERAGFEIVGMCEIEPYCQAVLHKHWPHVPLHDDIRSLNGRDIRADVICGGFPCKQTSTAAAIHGSRSGLDGAESALFKELARVVGECRPRWCVVENPAGVSTWAGQITRDLEAFGYGVSQSELAAEDFGAPHLRKRIIFVANRDGARLEIARPAGPSQAQRSAWRTPPGDFWREVEPGTWRMADGVSDRMDRINAIGNAIVPQMAEAVARQIMTVEGRESGMESPSARTLRNADDAASHPVIAENQIPPRTHRNKEDEDNRHG